MIPKWLFYSTPTRRLTMLAERLLKRAVGPRPLTADEERDAQHEIRVTHDAIGRDAHAPTTALAAANVTSRAPRCAARSGPLARWWQLESCPEMAGAT
jgi:hypothetical protein